MYRWRWPTTTQSRSDATGLVCWISVSSPSRGLRSSVATRGKPSDGTLNTADVAFSRKSRDGYLCGMVGCSVAESKGFPSPGRGSCRPSAIRLMGPVSRVTGTLHAGRRTSRCFIAQTPTPPSGEILLARTGRRATRTAHSWQHPHLRRAARPPAGPRSGRRTALMPTSALRRSSSRPSLIHDQHRAAVTLVAGDVVPHVIPDTIGIPASPPQQVLHLARRPVTGMLGDGPAVLPGRSVGNPSTNARAHRLGSTRPDRPAIRPISSSNISGHRAGSTLASAATARSSRVHTTRDDHCGGRSASSTSHRKITIYCWSVKPEATTGNRLSYVYAK
jgi:hypothetical protein